MNELLDLIQLGRWSNHYPSQLSGGQRQRVALARALAIEPSVLLLDEPFGALDAKVRQELRRWLRTLHAKIAVTSVLVTHDQEEALEVADRIVIMNQGRIEQTGTPDEVFHNPGVRVRGHVPRQRESVPWARGIATVRRPRCSCVRTELDIERYQSNGASVAARIHRIQSAGPIVRVELTSDQNDSITVEMTHERYQRLDHQDGRDGLRESTRARVFVSVAPDTVVIVSSF